MDFQIRGLPWQAIPEEKKIVLTLPNILKDQKVFWRIEGLTIRNESKKQRKALKIPERLANSKCHFFKQCIVLQSRVEDRKY